MGRAELDTDRQPGQRPVQGHRHRWCASQVGQLGERRSRQAFHGHLVHLAGAVHQLARLERQHQFCSEFQVGRRIQFADSGRQLTRGRAQVQIIALEKRAQGTGKVVPLLAALDIVRHRHGATEHGDQPGIELEVVVGGTKLLPRPLHQYRDFPEVQPEITAGERHAIKLRLRIFNQVPHSLQGTGSLFHRRNTFRRNLGIVGRFGEDADAQTPRRPLHQLGVGCRGRRDDKRIALGRTRQHIQHGGTVTDGSGDHVVNGSPGPGFAHERPAGYAPPGWLQAEQPVVGCRDPNGAPAIIGTGHRDNAGCRGGTGATTGTAGREIKVPGIAARAPEF